MLGVWPCGTGPTILVDDVPRQTRLIASPVDLYQGESVRDPPLRAGAPACPSPRARPRCVPSAVRWPWPNAWSWSAAPRRRQAGTPTHHRPNEPGRAAHHTGRRVAVLALRENSNPGWDATQGGADLESEIIDGWQQGWRTDGSDETVDASPTPKPPTDGGSWGGGAALLLLALLLLLSGPSLAGGHTQARREGVLGVRRAARGGPRQWAARRLGRRRCRYGGGGARRTGGSGQAGAGRSVAGGRADARCRPRVLPRPWADSAGWAGTWSWPAYLVVLGLSAAGAWAAPCASCATAWWASRPSGRAARR